MPIGTSRAVVLNALGIERRDTFERRRDASGRTIETYRFKEGLPLWSNVLRGIGYTAADTFTLCLWEIIGTSLESGIQKGLVENMVAEVRYDAYERVDRMKVMSETGELVYDTTVLALASP